MSAATVASLIVAAMVGEYSVLIMPFILSAMMDAFGLSEATAGRFVSLQLLGMAVGSALISMTLRPSQALRPRMRLAAFGMIVANAACALMHWPWTIGSARALTGVGEGVLMASANTAACSTSNPHRVFSAIALAAAIVGIGALMLTPLLATREGPRAVFWLMAGMPLLLLAVMRALPANSPAADHAALDVSGALRIGLPLLIGYAAFWAGSSGLWVYAERIGASQGMTPVQIGSWLSLAQISSVIAPIVSAWMAPRAGLRLCIVLGCLGMGLATLSFIFGGRPWTYGLGAFLASFMLMFVAPCFRSRMAALDPSGRTVALSAGVYTVGLGLAPLVVSIVTVEGRGYVGAGIFCLACFLGSAVLSSARYPMDSHRRSSVGVLPRTGA